LGRVSGMGDDDTSLRGDKATGFKWIPYNPAMIRIGIVGCGRILAAHLRGYRLLREARIDDFQITAMCSRKADDAHSYVERDKGPPQRQPVSEMPGDPLAVGDEYLSDFQPGVDVQVYDDYQKMIAEAPIDAVNDYSTHALHHQVAASSFEKGKHLLSQKPLAVTMAAARRTCEQAEAKDLTFGVFENARFRPQLRQVKWLFDSGILGKPQMILFGNVGNWWTPNRIVAHTPWRHIKAEAGGITLDMGVHLFDIVRYLGGQVTSINGHTAIVEPERVTLNAGGAIVDQIHCDADDTFFASFETESGVTGTVFASWAGHGGGTVVGAGPVIYGSGGRVEANTVHLDEGGEQQLDAMYEANADKQRKQRDMPFGLDDAFALSQHDWLQAIRRGGQPETSGREGLADLACAYAIVESAHAGRRVEVEEVATGSLCDYQAPIDKHFRFA